MKPDINMHVHTRRSACAKDEMTLESINRAAMAGQIRFVGLADHIDVMHHNVRPLRNREDLARGSWGVEFLVGCEATVLSPRRIAIEDSIARKLDYVMVSANHYHLEIVENPVRRDPASYAAHYLEMLEGILDWGLADIVAHPFLHTKIGRFLNPVEVLACYDWDRLERVMDRAAVEELAFEIKPPFLSMAPDFFRDLLSLGHRLGVKFSLGTDAHRLTEIAYPADFGETAESLGLCYGDLVDPGRYLGRCR